MNAIFPGHGGPARLAGRRLLAGMEPHGTTEDASRKTERTGEQPVVELAAGSHANLQGNRSLAVDRRRSQPGSAAGTIPPEALEKRASEAVLHTRINWAYRRWQEYMEGTDTWGGTHAGVLGHRPAAYFSAESGLHESLPIYSGGLGVLAGDHIKSASDLDIPLIGVGLFYGQ